jgi:hypothetical protein
VKAWWLPVVVGLATLMGCSAAGSGRQVVGAPQSMTIARFERTAATNCPRSYFGCVVVAYDAPGSIKVCLPHEGDCVRSGKPLKWHAALLGWGGRPALTATFRPNPGDPSTNRIAETKRLKSSGGRVAYVEYADGERAGHLDASLRIGIITR